MKSLEQQADDFLDKKGFDPNGRPLNEVDPEQDAFEASMTTRVIYPGVEK